MDNKEKNIYEELKKNVHKQLMEAFKEGAKEGAIMTCVTIYRVMKTWGLEETNLLYTLLKDIAKQNGCDSLEEKIGQVQAAIGSTEIPS